MRVRVMLAALCALIIAHVSSAQEIKDHHLTVRGKVRVFAKADRATMRFEIRGVGNSLKAAFENAGVKLDTVARKLYALGLTKQDLSTSFFRNQENSGDKAFLSSKRDYRALMTVSVTTQKLDLLEQIAMAVSESSVEQIENISFELVNYTELSKDAIAKATEAAKEKAETVAGKLGVRCGQVLRFEELEATEVENPYAGASSYAMAWRGDNKGEIFTDEVGFNAAVELTFAIEDVHPEIPATGKQ